MAVLYNIIQRAVLLRAGQLKADSAAALENAYADVNVGQIEMEDVAIHFPFTAVNDAILNAASRIVGMIGREQDSPYRTFFADATASITGSVLSGTAIPDSGTGGSPRIGVIGNVRDVDSGKRLTASDYATVIRLIEQSDLFEVPVYHYYTDNIRIWHTTASAVLDVVVWSETTQRSLMTSTPARGSCPFPDDLLPALVEYSLSFLFRPGFNEELAEQHRERANEMLVDLGIRTAVEERIATA